MLCVCPLPCLHLNVNRERHIWIQDFSITNSLLINNNFIEGIIIMTVLQHCMPFKVSSIVWRVRCSKTLLGIFYSKICLLSLNGGCVCSKHLNRCRTFDCGLTKARIMSMSIYFSFALLFFFSWDLIGTWRYRRTIF